MRQDPILRRAEFDTKVVHYWLISTTVVLIACVFTVVLVPLLWIFLPPILRRYLDRIDCELTTRSLIIRKGLLNRIEKTIPLDKITDLAMFQGPIMRAMGLKGFRVETAGSGGAATGYLVSQIGIIDTDGFRDAVLEQKEKIESSYRFSPPDATEAKPERVSAAGEEAVLAEMRDILVRIERHLGEAKAR